MGQATGILARPLASVRQRGEMKQSESRTAVYVGIAANILIAATKFAAALATGSSAMVAEGVHSVVDAGDGLLLLLGQHRAAQPADEQHPLGHGKELYFWSLIVAVLFFALGSGMSFYEGILHILHPEPIGDPTWNYIVLGAAMLFTFVSFGVAFKEFRKRLAGRSYWQTFRESKDPTLFTLVLEDLADMIGMLLAFLGVYLSRLLNKPYLDGAASVGVGVVMTVVAVLLARESKGLLVGEGATSRQREAIRRVASDDEAVLGIRRLVTMYFGPGTLLVALDVQFRSQLDSSAVAAAIVRMEARIRKVQHETMYIYVEATALAGATDVPAAANFIGDG